MLCKLQTSLASQPTPDTSTSYNADLILSLPDSRALLIRWNPFSWRSKPSHHNLIFIYLFKMTSLALNQVIFLNYVYPLSGFLPHFLHLVFLFFLPWNAFFKIACHPPRPNSSQKAFYLNFPLSFPPLVLTMLTLHLAYIGLPQLSYDAVTFVIYAFWGVYLISLDEAELSLHAEVLPSFFFCMQLCCSWQRMIHTVNIHWVHIHWLK